MLENFKQMQKIDFDPKPYPYVKDLSATIKELNQYMTKINLLYQKDQNNLAELCFYVHKVKELFSDYHKTYYNRLYDKKHNQISFETIMSGFGIDETQSSRLISCYEKFVTKETEKPILLGEFFGFSKSKLFELLTIPTEQLQSDIKNKVLKSDMSVASIREYVKNYKAMLKSNAKNISDFKSREDKPEALEEEIPPAYDPTKHYEFAYFESKTKAQLLNMIWELQKEKEKNSREKIKNGK